MRLISVQPQARTGGRSARGRTSLLRRPRPTGVAWTALITVFTAITTTLLAVGPASAQPVANAVVPHGTQRGPNPTLAMIEATRGPFATAQRSVAPGHGFNGGVVYYPTDTSQGTWGALAIVPGYTAKCDGWNPIG